MKIENQASLEKGLKDGISLFLGAGFSILAQNRQGQTLASGLTLRDNLCSHFETPEFQGLGLPEVTQFLNSISPEMLSNFLTNQYTVGTVS